MQKKQRTLKNVSVGFLTGAINGFFGGGGGMVAVPLLKSLSGYDEKRAHATAILVIAPVCAVSAIIYIINGYFRADVVIPVTIGAFAGGFVGAKLLGLLPEIWVKLIFIALMLFAGAWMLF